MLKLFGFIDSILLIGLIFLQIPRESLGLTKSVLFESPSAERSLNVLTVLGILIYIGIAIKLNLLSN